MIKKEKMKLISKKVIAKDTLEMVLENDYISLHAEPGQFVHILIKGLTLRRPVSIADTNPNDQTITILFKIVGQGTKQLASFELGKMLDVLGPLGNAFPIEEGHKKALLIGGGIGVPPLYYLGKKLVQKGIHVTSVLGYQTSDSVFYEKKFQALGHTYFTTDDGSFGEQGLVVDIIPKIAPFDTYYACGPTPMLQAIQENLHHAEGYISLEERMGCGIGACFACVIPTIDGLGYKKLCQDGPVFHAKEVHI